jgi:hypothetical protein
MTGRLLVIKEKAVGYLELVTCNLEPAAGIIKKREGGGAGVVGR